MLLANNYYVFKELSFFDPETYRLVSTDEKYDYSKKISGLYSNVNDELIVFYRRNGRLNLLLNNCFYDFDQLQINVVNRKKTVVGYELRWEREVEITLRDQIIYKYGYSNFCQEFVDDPTPFMDPEDFDFYLLLRNVSKDAPRKERFFTSFVE